MDDKFIFVAFVNRHIYSERQLYSTITILSKKNNKKNNKHRTRQRSCLLMLRKAMTFVRFTIMLSMKQTKHVKRSEVCADT